MENWDFDCPKYVNLASGSDESVEQLEKYFEEDHEHVSHRPNTRAATAAQAALKGQEDIKHCRNSKKNIAGPSSAGAFSRRQPCFGDSDKAREAEEPEEAEGQNTNVKKSLPKKERVMDKSVKGRTLSQVKKVSSNKKKRSARNKPPMPHQTPSVVRSTFEAISVRKGASTSRVKNTIVPSAVKNSMPPSAVCMSGTAALHVRKGAATSTTSKPIVPSAVKKSMPLSAAKNRIVPLTVEQHVHPSAICKGATAALRMRKDATPAVRKPALPAAQCQSLAEFVGKFHSKTPTRFRRVPKDPGGHYEDMRFKAPTIPVSPKLSTRLRSRTVSLRDQKRKADHVNICASEPKRPMVEAVQVDTQATPMSKPALNIEKDEQDSLASKISTKPPQEKLANTAASSKVLRRVTVAKSPAFSLKLRSETWKQRKQMEERTLGMKSEKQPEEEVKGNRKNKPPLGAKHPQTVKLKGSSYQGNREGTQDERCTHEVEKRTCSTNRKKNQETLNECKGQRGKRSCGIAKNRNRTLSLRRSPSGHSCANGDAQPPPFRARPAPDRKCMFRLRNTSAPPTVPRPFRLASVERHYESRACFMKKQEEMEAERLRKLKFVARPVPRSIRNRSVTRSTDGEQMKNRGPSGHVSRPRKR